jgi:hypothetical protein
MRKIIALILWTMPAVNLALSLVGLDVLHYVGNGNLFAADYYFSSIKGNDNNSGANSTSPWKSMEKLKQIAGNLKEGDNVFFERGSEWEQVKISLVNLRGTETNPIEFKAYGSGPKPRFKGSKSVSSFTREGNIWKMVDPSLPDYIADSRRLIPYVYINDIRYGVSRYPNSGVLSTTTSGTKNYLDDSKGWSDNQWKNGMVAIRCVSWDWTTRRINSNTSSRLNFDALPFGLSKNSTEYLINNHKNACDVAGEWAQQNDTLWIFYAKTLSDQQVEVPVIDTMIRINNCRYMKFENLQFERSVMSNIAANQSYIVIASCTISDAGNALLLISDGSYIDMFDNHLSYGRRAGMYLDGSSGNIHRNVFENMISQGADNGERANGACINNWHCNGITQIHHNRFDSINIAYNGHWSNADVYIFRNFINNYGLTIEDCGAIYIGGDFTNYKKYVTRNIILNAGNKYCHAVYMDYLTSNVVSDSNTIYNSNIAFNFHVCDDNLVRYNNIVYPAKDMAYPWNSAFRFDEYSFNYGGEGNQVRRNAVENNNIVLGSNPDEVGSAFLNVTYVSENTSVNNKYFDPFTTDDDIVVKGESYDLSSYKSYRLSDWNASTGLETGSSRNPNNWTMQSTTGVAQKDFVKLLINPTDKDSVVDLRLFGAKYIDVKGVLHSDFITIAPYYSVILFYREAQSATNHQPVVGNSRFTYYIRETDDATVGNISASDPESYQTLNYAISAGNQDGLVGVNRETGELYMINKNVVIADELNLQLTVEVSDNGSPSLKGTGQAEITLIPFNNPPLLNNQSFVINESSGVTTLVGNITANDPDADQVLRYEIISGDPFNHFLLDASTGELNLASTGTDFLKDSASVLFVRAEDNGPVAKNATAYITVSLIPASTSNTGTKEPAETTVTYIDPENKNDLQENGSLQHPFDTWGDVKWVDGQTYLQKRGTVAPSNKINIFASRVTLGAYGTGERPVIQSNTKDFAIRAYEKSNITILGLHIIANDAISCIYFMGESSNNNLVENCKLEGSENGVRIIDGKSYVIKYNSFYNRADAIYSFAENTEIYYNVFKSNTTAVNVSSYLSMAKIYNNVFYDNNQGIVASYSDLVIYNNIFYLTRPGDVAINNNMDKMISDHNIFYPEQQGFITMATKAYSSLDEYQKDKGIDLNSFSDDPMFKDIYNENFALLAESPGIDAGINVGLDFDFDGLALPSGGAPNIGLLESTGQTGSPTAILKHDAEGLQDALSVYPNPSDGRFNLYVGVSDICNSSIEVKDMSGRLVYHQTHNSSESSCVLIDISDKPQGIYIVVLQLKDKVYSERVIVR